MSEGSFVRWFRDLGLGDVPLVGGKNASLGELVRALAPAGSRSLNPDAVVSVTQLVAAAEAVASGQVAPAAATAGTPLPAAPIIEGINHGRGRWTRPPRHRGRRSEPCLK
jgi:hypothetical protein